MPPDLQNEEPRILERIRRGERIAHYETIRTRKDGRSIDISLTISPVKNSLGKIIAASKIARDITDQKRSAAQLAILAREAEHRTKNILTTHPSGHGPVAKRFRSEKPDMPVVYISGEQSDPERIVPGSLFVAKPYQHIDILNACLRLRAKCPSWFRA